MKHFLIIFGLLVFLPFAGLAAASEHLIRGYHIDAALRMKAGISIAPGKSIILAQVFNADSKELCAGEYEIGVELNKSQKRQVLTVKPSQNIAPGSMQSFRIVVPADEASPFEYKLYAKIGESVIYSDTAFVSGLQDRNSVQITTLFTEAPPEPADNTIVPPKEVPFEHELSARSRSTSNDKAEQATVQAKQARKRKPAVKPEVDSESKVAEKNTEAVPTGRTIDPAEFKSLRTIDEELVIYVIKEGDTLKSIAKQYYGDSARERTIADLNFIEKTSAVKVGEEIIVDVKPLGKAIVPKPHKSNSAGAGNDSRTYEIQTGDTLAGIAKMFYGRTSKVSLIMKANPGLDPQRLRVGTKIILPMDGDQV